MMSITYNWSRHYQAYILNVNGVKEYLYTKKALERRIATLEDLYDTKVIKVQSEEKRTQISRIGEKVRDTIEYAYSSFYEDGMYYLVSQAGYIIAEYTNKRDLIKRSGLCY